MNNTSNNFKKINNSIKTKEIEYQAGTVIAKSFLAYNTAVTKPMPAILVVHDWSGRNDFYCNKAIELANNNYIGLAIDMYGYAKQGETKEQKRALLDPIVVNRKELLARITAAYDAVLNLDINNLDKNKIIAIGYCFGGMCVLDLARSGCSIQGVISFHARLNPPDNIDYHNTKINTKILVLHGYNDKLVPPEQIIKFSEEMNNRKANWQFHIYGNTKHSFTNPEANDIEMGLEYNKLSDFRSWQIAELFFEEVFK